MHKHPNDAEPEDEAWEEIQEPEPGNSALDNAIRALVTHLRTHNGDEEVEYCEECIRLANLAVDG